MVQLQFLDACIKVLGKFLKIQGFGHKAESSCDVAFLIALFVRGHNDNKNIRKKCMDFLGLENSIFFVRIKIQIHENNIYRLKLCI